MIKVLNTATGSSFSYKKWQWNLAWIAVFLMGLALGFILN